jgi:hypothetical protein
MIERFRLHGTANSDPRDAPAQTGAAPWPADQIERWPIDRLVPYARNARTHSEAQIDQIAASIREWGWTMPVLVGRKPPLEPLSRQSSASCHDTSLIIYAYPSFSKAG